MDWGVLSLMTSDGAPYGVPLNYAWDEKAEVLVFHGALEGRKLSWTAIEPEACFTVVARGEVLAGQLTSAYTSVMAFGTLVRVTDREQTTQALRLLAQRCQPAGTDIDAYLENAADKTAVFFLKIQLISGKRRDGR